jgi:hypothetical protein
VDDIRYKDANWLRSQRHWPPRCLLPTINAVQMQLKICQSVPCPRTSISAVLPAAGELVARSRTQQQFPSCEPMESMACQRLCIVDVCRLLKDLEAFKAIRAV